MKDIIYFRPSAYAQEYLLQLGDIVSCRPEAEHRPLIARQEHASVVDRLVGRGAEIKINWPARTPCIRFSRALDNPPTFITCSRMSFQPISR